MRPRARINRRPFRLCTSVRRSHRPGAHTHHARPLRSMRDISVRKRGKRMPCARHIERDCIDLEQLRTALSANTCPAPPASAAERSDARETSTRSHTANRLQLRRSDGRQCLCSDTCAGRRGVLHGHPGSRRQCGCRRARIAFSVCAAHPSGNREASARTRCARMACRVQWRASVSWRCLKTLGTHSALMPATCRDANEAQESNVRIQ